MANNLVIMESPTKAGTVKSYLGSGYKVVATTGHVRDLPKSTLGIDIENGYEAKYINIRGKGQLINELKKEAKHADKVFIATDPDREGEAIAWHVASVLGIEPDSARRVTFNEITKNAVKAGIKQPRPIDMNLVNSQQARRILDRIVGYKLSPFLWKTVQGGLSAGRVQSVAVRIIVDRENEIRAFVPEEYWTIDCTLEKDNGKAVKVKFYGDGSGKLQLKTKDDADRVLDGIAGRQFRVASIKKASRLKNPQPPFTTSTLQQEGIRKLGFRSAQVMKVAQELYEGINLGSEFGGTQGLITYMRTDSLRIAESAQESARNYLAALHGDNYISKTPRVYKTKASAQDAHEAIRPSDITLDPEKIKGKLSNEQYKLYKLIWSRFAASQMASAELETVTADIECGGYIFRAAGYTVKFPGYLAVWDDTDRGTGDEGEEMEKTALPPLDEGEKLACRKTDPRQHFTEPPPRYNEASLVKLFEEKGIGRPSTYATIITTITQRGYVEREGKALKPTQLGEVTNSLMLQYFSEIVDTEFTAQMEDDLDNIEQGQSSIRSVLDEFYLGFAENLAKASDSCEQIKLEPVETDIYCEKCGAKMIIKNGRFGKFAACPNYPECKNTRRLNKDGTVAESKPVEKTDLKCELCGADIVIRTGRYGRFYACSNYPKCRFTRPLEGMLEDVVCPECGGKIFKKSSKKGIFYACENSRTCKFITWDVPLADKCPQCGKMLFRKKLKTKTQIVCHDKVCGYKLDIEEPETDAETFENIDGNGEN